LVLNLAQPRFGFSSHLARVKVDDGAVILREEPVHVCGSPQPFGVPSSRTVVHVAKGRAFLARVGPSTN
jgi:hypothetical protein